MEIGGYFELELSVKNNMPNKDGILVNSCRNALELILENIDSVKHLYIPYYTCDSILEPINKLDIKYTFYSINENLEFFEDITLAENEYIIYTNYFGIKDKYINTLIEKYKNQIIIDNAQALYSEPTSNCIYSPRKFVGIPDGGIVFTNTDIDISKYPIDESFNRCSQLLIRYDRGASEGYSEFKANSLKLKNNNIKQISNLTKRLISSIDFEEIKKRRIDNFIFLHNNLKAANKLKIDDINYFKCPLVYPFLTDDVKLKSKLIENKIYVATYWPNVFEWCKEGDFEYKLAKQLIALPIDQRYDIDDMKRIINIIYE